MPWQWDNTVKNYRNSDTGRFISRKKALEHVSNSIENSTDIAADLAEMVSSGQITAGTWELQMRESLKKEYIRQYMLGRGGLAQMKAEDWGSIGGMLSEQFSTYLEPFAERIANGDYSEAQIANFAGMYFNSAREAHGRAQARAYELDVNALPDYPGAGNTPCLTKCGCNWRIEIFRDDQSRIIRWEAYWELGSRKEHCAGCTENNSLYYPFIIEPSGP